MFQVTQSFRVRHKKSYPKKTVSAETISLALNLESFGFCFFFLWEEECLKRIWHSESQSQQIHTCLSIYNQDNPNPLADVTELRHEHEFRKQYEPSFVRKAWRQNPSNWYHKSLKTLLWGICHLREIQNPLLTCLHLLWGITLDIHASNVNV